MRWQVPRILLTWLALSALLLAAPSGLEAQSGGLFLQLDTQFERSQNPDLVAGLRDVQSVGLAIDAYAGTRNAGLAAFLDAHFGGGLQGGFAYRVALLPLGLSLYRRDQIVGLAISTGLQLQGVTGHQLAGLQLPVRVSAHLRIGSHVLLDVWGSSETSLGERRDAGAQNALFGDELRTGLSLRIGRGGKRDEGRQRVVYGSGYFIGAHYAERLKTSFWGLAIGHGIDMHGG